MEDYNKIYPDVSNDGKMSRLHQIAKYLSELVQELNQREKILKKYKLVNCTLSKCCAVCGSQSVTLVKCKFII